MKKPFKTKLSKRHPIIGREKYNWPLLLDDFLKSNYMEVRAFFEARYGKLNGNIRTKTTGWHAMKEKYIQDIADASIARVKKNKEDVLSEALSNAITVAADAIKEATRLRGHANADVIKKFWSIIRTESGLPVNITKLDMSMAPTQFEDARKSFDDKFNESTPKSDAAPGKGNASEDRPAVSRKPKA